MEPLSQSMGMDSEQRWKSMIMILANVSILIWIRVVLFRKDQMKKLFLLPILLWKLTLGAQPIQKLTNVSLIK